MGFFFQAEDGIRDVAVTGVQTCALPISYCLWEFQDQLPSRLYPGEDPGPVALLYRSEERRVGKEVLISLVDVLLKKKHITHYKSSTMLTSTNYQCPAMYNTSLMTYDLEH